MVSFTLVLNGENHIVEVREGQYFSLMSLIADHLPMYGFGLCSGMGSCGTCLVKIHERQTLACTVAVNDALNDMVIEIEPV
jgi:aerobic-type carbon monoxide dehydrogenase small subunit (CoxS/CutS family)